MLPIALKCLTATAVILFVHWLSQSDRYYLSGLALSCPVLSIIGYVSMYLEHGKEKVQATLLSAMPATVPFLVFLLTFYILLKHCPFIFSACFAFIVWGVLAWGFCLARI